MRDQAERLRTQCANDKKEAKTIAVVSGKGGVGKSNTALNFSLELQNRGNKVLLIDLDVGMGNIDILLGRNSMYSIAHLFTDFRPLHDIIELGPFNLSYVSGGSSLNELLQLDETKLNYFYREYDQAVYEYDYILFDLGAGATSASLAFILAADECLVVTTPEPTAITDSYSMIKHIVSKRSDIPIYVLMNRCEDTREGEKMLERFKQIVNKFLHVDVTKMGMLPTDKTVQHAVINQTPFLLYNQDAPVSRALKEITTNYLRSSNKINKLKPVSFVQRLKRLINRG